MAASSQSSKPWFRLDNAAKMYSAIQRKNYSALYRFSAVMKEKVDPEVLQRAIDKTLVRFPGFHVKIKRGMFWYYFESDDSPGPFLQKDISNPCQPVRFQNKDQLLRFFYYENRISVEVFHALADGAGTVYLLKTLLAVYLRELGHHIPCTDGVLDINDPPDPEEWEDAYARYATSRVRLGFGHNKAYPCVGTPEPFYTLNVTMGFLSVEEVRKVSRQYGASISEYLAAALIESILLRQRREDRRKERPVALAVPINLRPYLPSKTLRNFIFTIRPSIDPRLGDYTFREIVSQVHHHMRLHSNRQEMQAAITHNVSLQRYLPLKLVPSPVKNFALNLGYRLAGSRPFSTTFTNPGPFTVPQEMIPHIQHVEVMLGQSYAPRVNCAVISFQDTLEITFAGTVKETDVEREFFRHLVKDGLHVKVTSNRKE
ncbi:MAG: hypothetical protein SOR61_06695 [Evtepia sp.]|uniref:hypothetical protein n=1 Tax=Evtepia sp. TaxID=2773933 RepID=UPI002A74CF95|nr:hypothetical protein [Evtepia sp.]MDY3014856.1 hypothetical protein [Evtepia sp.]